MLLFGSFGFLVQLDLDVNVNLFGISSLDDVLPLFMFFAILFFFFYDVFVCLFFCEFVLKESLWLY